MPVRSDNGSCAYSPPLRPCCVLCAYHVSSPLPHHPDKDLDSLGRSINRFPVHSISLLIISRPCSLMRPRRRNTSKTSDAALSYSSLSHVSRSWYDTITRPGDLAISPPLSASEHSSISGLDCMCPGSSVIRMILSGSLAFLQWDVSPSFTPHDIADSRMMQPIISGQVTNFPGIFAVFLSLDTAALW